MKRSTNSKKYALAQTGAAGKDYTQLDEIMLDVLGRDTAQANGLNQEDEPPVMPESQEEDGHNPELNHNSSAGKTLNLLLTKH